MRADPVFVEQADRPVQFAVYFPHQNSSLSGHFLSVPLPLGLRIASPGRAALWRVMLIDQLLSPYLDTAPVIIIIHCNVPSGTEVEVASPVFLNGVVTSAESC